MKAKVFAGRDDRISRNTTGHGNEHLKAAAGNGRLACAAMVSLLLCTEIVLLSSRAMPATIATGGQVLQGKLVTVSGIGPALKVQSKQYPLAGWNPNIFHTLQDKRLQNDEVHLRGKMLSDGDFQVDDIHTVHHGKLYIVRYYCETCNISALEPGNCVCCQQPTELQEVPVDAHDKNVLITH